ncbi:MAG: hypothetical protein ACYTHJ_10865 [Planctomycetota bacterium]|jgi:hypothetical protein
MGLRVTFVSGLRRSGKSAVIRTMIDRIWKKQPHYIRLVDAGGDKHPPKTSGKPPRDCGVATARWLEYRTDQVFEILPDTLATIHRQDRYGSVVIEADSDPVLRCAYPYDHRVFVMPVPTRVNDVFRDASQAAHELQHVLEDTAAFASEIFGLFSQSGTDDAEPSEERPDLTETCMRGFLYSPLGDELATRIQLKPDYHGLVESDVIIVNTGAGQAGPNTRECVNRIGQLIERVRGMSGVSSPKPELFHCDPRDPTGGDCKRMMRALKPMCMDGK